MPGRCAFFVAAIKRARLTKPGGCIDAPAPIQPTFRVTSCSAVPLHARSTLALAK